MQRQYTGTAGRIENAQVAVYLTYAGAGGHAMIDRELYLPESWTDDPDRCAAAGVPDDIEFATKPALAQAMLTRALDAGVPARWVAGDEVYGADPALRAELEARGVGYVLAIGCDRRVPTAAGPVARRRAHRAPAEAGLAAALGRAGRQGPAVLRLGAGRPRPTRRRTTAHRQCWWLLVRRHRRTGELAFYRCYAPDPVPLRRTGPRRRSPLDRRGILPGRQGPGRPRRAPGPPLDVLAALDPARDARPRPARRDRRHRARRTAPAPAGLIALTCNEIRRLLTTLIIEPARTLACPHAWSDWRRRHQHRARTSHYRRQEATT